MAILSRNCKKIAGLLEKRIENSYDFKSYFVRITDPASMNNDNILEQINKSALRFLEPLTPEKTYQMIVEEALKLVEGEDGLICLENGEGELKIVYACPQSLTSLKLRKRGFTYVSYKTRKAMVIYPEDYGKYHPEVLRMGIQSAILIPLSYRNKSFGAMNIMLRQRDAKFTPKHLEVLKVFGSLATLAIRKTQLYDETRQALEDRDVFLSMAAHELRTPLTTISGYAQILRAKLTDYHATERRWAEDIYGETSRLSRLVNELLEAHRIKSGNIQYRWRLCQLKELINKATETFSFTHPDHVLNYEDHLNGQSDIVVGDFDKLLQVINNILDNAAKFSAAHQPITVSLRSTTDDIVLSVKDQGAGITKPDQVKIFQGFYRGSNNSKEGMGLGLYISKEIIEQHRGEITIKSKVNKGAIFEVTLPKTTVRA